MSFLYNVEMSRNCFSVIVTTDVEQSVAFLTPNSVTIQCTFIPGSQSKGCHAKIIGSDRSMEAHNIKRVDGRLFVQEEFPITKPPEAILVFDWESDGSIGNLSIPVHILRTASTAGPGQYTPGAHRVAKP